ncbi:Hypothetical predicted protein [Paramuricea clavata]|uniref:Uncharacterized protein n=1 Tax=Paramuricea clavata TaxID=317549 RepID=A0A7D9DQ59_PARCT|nr:Hypothetical predicted protein [Paramuricea clavata]
MEDFVKNEREEIVATGIEEEFGDLEQLLLDIYERARDAATALAKQLEEKEKAADDERQQIADVRTQAMENKADKERHDLFADVVAQQQQQQQQQQAWLIQQ